MVLLANHGFPLKKGGILSTITQNRIRQQYLFMQENQANLIAQLWHH
jgi:hypothetical protein